MQIKQTYTKWLALLAVLLLFLAVRLPGLGRYITIDEVFWLTKSAELSVSVAEQDWAATGLAGHPGLTTAWAGVLGIQSRIPDFSLNPPQLITDFHLRNHFRQLGYNPIEILAAARQVMVLFNAAVFALILVYAHKLWGLRIAAVAAAVMALDPFLIAHQRLLHQDGLMAGLAVLCLLAAAAWLRERSLLHAAVSGLAAGLAWLTKSPTLALGPCILALALWQAYAQRGPRASLRPLAGGLLVWGLAAALVFVALWPKMWVMPAEALGQMWSYAAESAGGEHSGPIFFNGLIYPDGELGAASTYFYLFSLLWRAAPVTSLGLTLAIWATARPAGAGKAPRDGVAGLVLFGLLFLLVMSIAAKKFDRYMLPAYASLVLLAGWGVAVAWERWRAARPAWAQWAAVGLLLAAQLAGALSVYPYYLSYYNQLWGGAARAQRVMMLGWGEGLEQAAAYLSGQPGIADMRVASWYSNAFNMAYPYQAGDIPIASTLPAAQLQDLLAHDYLVIYVHQWQRGTPQNLLDALAPLQPVHTVVVDGIEYVRIYKP